MSLVRTTLLSTVGVVVKILSMLAVNKILAVYLGPAGYPVIGQFQNFIAAISTIASGGISTGVIKYTSECQGKHDRLINLWYTSAIIVLISSATVLIGLFLFNNLIARYIKIHDNYIIFFIGVSLPLYGLNTLLISIINGNREIKKLVLANISNNIIVLASIWVGASVSGLDGSILSIAISQSIVCVPTFLLFLNSKDFDFRYLQRKFEGKTAKLLLGYSTASLITSIVAPITIIIVRAWLIKDSGIDSAGYWDAIVRLAGVATIFISTPLSIYFIPRISGLNNKKALIKEIKNGYFLLMPILFIGGGIVYIIRDYIIEFLFTVKFYPMRELFGWQIIGEILRCGSWILSYYLLGKAMIGRFIIIEIFCSISYLIVVFVLVKNYGLIGAPMGYAINSLLYLVMLAYTVKQSFEKYDEL